MSWKRPESVTFPQVWMAFEAKDPDTGKLVTYRIQDLPEDRFQEAVILMRTVFARDETMCKSLGLYIFNNYCAFFRKELMMKCDILLQIVSMIQSLKENHQIC